MVMFMGDVLAVCLWRVALNAISQPLDKQI